MKKFKDIEIGECFVHPDDGSPNWKIELVKNKDGKLFNTINEDDMKLTYTDEEHEFELWN